MPEPQSVGRVTDNVETYFALGNEKKNAFFFCIALVFS